MKNDFEDRVKLVQTKHPGKLCLIRVGDFYEALGDDAKQLAQLCDLTLTRRGEMPMSGFPYHMLGRVENTLNAHDVAFHVEDDK